MRHERQEVPPPPPTPVVMHHITLTEAEARELYAILESVRVRLPGGSAARQLLGLLAKRNEAVIDERPF